MSEVMENFTKVPNIILDGLMPILKPQELLVVLLTVRKTIGFTKKSDGISISQFVTYTGVSRSQVTKIISSLKDKKILKVTRQTLKNGGKSYNRYSLNLKGIKAFILVSDKAMG